VWALLSIWVLLGLFFLVIRGSNQTDLFQYLDYKFNARDNTGILPSQEELLTLFRDIRLKVTYS
jgi:5-methylcytosine-specific restriction endonuclease McrBC regulatory subunit McrC